MTEANVLETALMNAVKPSYNIHVRCPNCLKGVTTDNGEWLIWCGEKKHAEAILKAGCRFAEIEKAVKAGTRALVPVKPTMEMWAAFYASRGMVEPQFSDWLNSYLYYEQERSWAAMLRAHGADPLISGGG